MVGRRSQRKKVASPPQEDPDPMLESSITTPQARHPEPEPQPDPQPELHTEPEPAEPVVPPKHPQTYQGQAQFARMSIDDGMESGESSYRTTMPAPEAITFTSPDVLEHDQDEDDDSIIMIEPCTDFANYSSWLKRNFYHLIHKKDTEFIDNNLVLHSREDLFHYYYFKPIQWVDFLGKIIFLKNWKLNFINFVYFV